MKKIFIAAAALAMCHPAAAQTFAQAATQPSDSVRLVEMDDIQVFSSRADSKTPVAYTDLGREQISQMNYGQDIPYLLSLTPSVVATSDAGTGIGYTGIRIRGVDASRINVTSNGVPMNDAESHNMFWVNVPDIASSVEDIQVQRGVGTSTNGAGAFGGSINLKTQSSPTAASAEASVSYGSFNTHKEHFKVNTGLINGKWAFGARLSNINSDGYIDRATSDMKSWFAQGGYYDKGTVVKLVAFGGKEKTYHAWDGITRAQLETDRRYNPCGEIFAMERDGAGRPVLDSKGEPETRVTGFYDDQHDLYSQTHFQLIFNQELSKSWKLNATLHYTLGNGYYEEYKNGRSLVEYGLETFLTPEPGKADWLATDGSGNYVVDALGNYTVDKSNLVRRKQMENDFYGGIISAHYTDRRLTASVGGAFNRYDGEHFGRVIWIKNYIGNLDPAHRYYENETDKRDANVFIKANYEIIRGLNIYADMQYRHISHQIDGRNDTWDWNNGRMQTLDVDKKYDFFNPKAGIFYTINDHNNVYGSFAIAHKEPTRNNYTDAKADRSPKPERVLDYELGYTFRSRLFTAGVNLYYMDYKDQLVLTGETNEIGEQLSDNVATSYRMGIELSAGIKITEWLRWDANATFSRNIIKDYTEYLDDFDKDWNSLWTQSANPIGDVTIAFSPSIIASSLISVRLGDFGASLQSQYVGSQYVTNSEQDGRKDSSGGYELDPLKLDAYFVNNLRLDYTFRLKSIRQLTVGVAVNNLFNAKYCSNGWGYSSLVQDGSGGTYRYNEMGYYPQATINVLANVTLRF